MRFYMLAEVDCWQAGAGLTGLLNGWLGGWNNSLVVDDGADACCKYKKIRKTKWIREFRRMLFKI